MKTRVFCFYSKDQVEIHNFGDADLFVLKDDYDILQKENEAMRTALKEIWTSEFVNWGEGSDFQKYVDEQFKKLNL